MTDVSRKRCNLCNQWYPATVEYFNTKTTADDGLTKACTKCLSKRYTPVPQKPVKPRPPKRPKRLRITESGVVELRCGHCGEYKPATADYYYRDKGAADGFTNFCKTCHDASIKASHERRIERLHPEVERRKREREEARLRRQQEIQAEAQRREVERQQARQLRDELIVLERSGIEALRQDGRKRCSECGQVYPMNTRYFRQHPRSVDGYSPLCRVCATRKMNGDAAAQKRMAIMLSDELWSLEQARRKERRLAMDRKKERKYRSSTKGKSIEKARTQKRRARKLSLPNTLTTAEWRYALDYFDHRCAVCGKPEGLFDTLAMDHWIPLSYKGEDNPGTVAENVVPLCHVKIGSIGGGCNNHKGNKSAHEWLVEEFGERKAKQIEKRIQSYFDIVRQRRLRDTA